MTSIPSESSRMLRRLLGAATAAGLFLGLVGLTQTPAGADDSETPTIKAAMQKLHKGPNSAQANLKKALATPSPDWKSIQSKTKDYVILGASLAKNEPKKGDLASWKKLSEGFFTDSKALDDAAKTENLKATQDAFKKVNGSCMACHKVHKG